MGTVGGSGIGLAFGLLLAFQAVAAPAPGRRALAVLGVGGGAGMDSKTLETVEELILGALADTGRFKVVGRSDLGAVMGFEKQRQALGCEQSAACLAEIAGALGVDFIGVPNVGKLGSGIVVSLKLIEAKTAAVLVRARRTVGSENELEAAIVGLAKEVAQAAGAEPGSPPLPPLYLERRETGSSYVMVQSRSG